MTKKAIILAAGLGKRLSSLTKEKPKSLLRVNGETILEYQKRVLQECGVENITIVTGYKSEKIERTLGPNTGYIYNPFYAVTGSLVSLWFAKSEMKHGFIYLHGDVLFHKQILKKLLSTHSDISLVVAKKQCVTEDMKVRVNSGQIIEINKSIEASEAYGEFVGLAKFSRKGAKTLVTILEKIVREGNLTDYFEYAIQRLVNEGHKVHKCDVNNLPWVEIDFVEDFEKAKKVVYPRIKNS